MLDTMQSSLESYQNPYPSNKRHFNPYNENGG